MGRRGEPVNDGTVPIGEWWVDDDGAWRGGAYLNLIAPMDTDGSRHDAECGALFHLGMAQVRLASNRIQVRWSVQHVMPDTLMAVKEFLGGLAASPRIVLEYYFGAWERLYFSNPDEARACLDAAMTYRDTIPIPKPFVRQVLIDDDKDRVPVIRDVLNAWEQSSGQFSLADRTLFSPYNQRVLVFTPNAAEDDLIYDFLGSQAALTRFKGPSWAADVKGKTCGRGVESDDPYSNVLTGPYGEVLQKGTARLDHIRARITRHTQTSEWVTYQRLLLPAKGDRGEPLVLCMAARTHQVSIPSPVKTA